MEMADNNHEGSNSGTESTSGQSLFSSCEMVESPIADSPAMTTVKSLNKALTRWEILDPMTDEQCLLATPWVRGLDLKTKEWGIAPVSRVKENFVR